MAKACSVSGEQKGFTALPKVGGGLCVDPCPDVTPSDIVSPEVSTIAATGVTTKSMDLNGSIDEFGSYVEGYVFFQWREQGQSSWNETTLVETTQEGAFTEEISGLTKNTTYEFRAGLQYGQNMAREFGSTLSETTKAVPEVTTLAATNVTTESMQFNGTLDTLGSFAAVDVFFQWRVVGAPTWTETTLVEQVSTGAFNAVISGLTEDTEYEFRAAVEYDDS